MGNGAGRYSQASDVFSSPVSPRTESSNTIGTNKIIGTSIDAKRKVPTSPASNSGAVSVGASDATHKSDVPSSVKKLGGFKFQLFDKRKRHIACIDSDGRGGDETDSNRGTYPNQNAQSVAAGEISSEVVAKAHTFNDRLRSSFKRIGRRKNNRYAIHDEGTSVFGGIDHIEEARGGNLEQDVIQSEPDGLVKNTDLLKSSTDPAKSEPVEPTSVPAQTVPKPKPPPIPHPHHQPAPPRRSKPTRPNVDWSLRQTKEPISTLSNLSSRLQKLEAQQSLDQPQRVSIDCESKNVITDLLVKEEVAVVQDSFSWRVSTELVRHAMAEMAASDKMRKHYLVDREPELRDDEYLGDLGRQDSGGGLLSYVSP